VDVAVAVAVVAVAVFFAEAGVEAYGLRCSVEWVASDSERGSLGATVVRTVAAVLAPAVVAEASVEHWLVQFAADTAYQEAMMLTELNLC